MRVLLDLRSAHPRLTGIGRYAVNLCLSLEKIREACSLEVICTEGGTDYLKGLIESRINIVPGDAFGWDDFVLPDLLSHLETDIYHSPFFALPKIRVCPSLCTVHDVIPMARPDLASAGFSQLFHKHVRRVLERSTHLVTVSEYSGRDIVRYFPHAAGRITVIPEPVNPLFGRRAELECEEVLAKFRLSMGFILFVGAVDRRKNVSTLLQAYGLLKHRLPAVPRLVIVGGPSGDGYDLKEQLSKLRLEQSVTALGRVSDEELASLYSSASVFAFPSLYEGFGLPILEAMASGVPVVTSRVTSLPEVAGGAALLVDPSNPQELCDALVRLLQNPDLRSTFVSKGLERAKEFSLERQGRSLLDLYRRVIGEAA